VSAHKSHEGANRISSNQSITDDRGNPGFSEANLGKKQETKKLDERMSETQNRAGEKKERD